MNIAQDGDTISEENGPKFCVEILNVVHSACKNNVTCVIPWTSKVQLSCIKFRDPPYAELKSEIFMFNRRSGEEVSKLYELIQLKN